MGNTATTDNAVQMTCLNASTVDGAHTVLGKPVRPFAVQAHFDQRIRIVDRRIRIGDDAVKADEPVHVGFPALVVAALENFNFLASSENHAFLLIRIGAKQMNDE